jgi:hypothetical protein
LGLEQEMTFETIKKDVLYADGSLRDIVITGTSRQVYCELCEALSLAGISYKVEIDGTSATLDEALGQFDRGSDRLLPLIRFHAGSVCIVCHMFDEAEVEMDFVPNEVKTDTDWQDLLRVLRFLSAKFRQTLGIYPENDHATRLYEIAAQQSAHPLPCAPRKGHSEGER